MSRMFKSVSETWNPVKGCLHECLYCFARDIAQRNRFKLPKYQDGFSPRFFPEELFRKFLPNILVFVVVMGDLFGNWVDEMWIQQILTVVQRWPQTDFLFLTKNPQRYRDFVFPRNAIIGTTLETNRCYGPEMSLASSVEERYYCLGNHPHQRKFVSIEPVMDLDVPVMLEWVEKIAPEIVELGLDNYGHNLPEPDNATLISLMHGLQGCCGGELKVKDSVVKRLGKGAQ